MGILDFKRVPDKALPERLSEGELNATYGPDAPGLKSTYAPSLGWDSSTQGDVAMKGDAITLTNAAMVASSTTLTSASAAFTSADIGKRVIVAGAAASGAPLRSTISAVTNTTTAVLSNAATTTVSGAKCVYGTNDTAALVAGAIAAAAKKRVFVLAAGKSYLIDPVTIESDNVRIHGYGATLISTMWSADNVLGFYVAGNNLEFRGFTLDLAVPDPTPQAGYMNYDMMRVGAKVGSSAKAGLKIIDCTFPNAAAGVNAYRTSFVRIQNCTVIGSHGNSIGAVSCPQDVVITGNRCSNGNDDLIAVTSDTSLTVPTTRAIVTNNNLDTGDASGIKIAGADHVVVNGNNVKNTYTAAIMVIQDTYFNMLPTHRVIVTSNIVEDGGQCFGTGRSHATMSTAANAIQVSSNAADCIVAHNILTNSGNRAITIPNANAGITVSANRIVGAGGTGISLGNVTDNTFSLVKDLVLTNNVIRNVQGGIAVGSATGATVTGNIVRSYSSGGGVGYRGIQYGYLQNANITDNIITNDDGGGATTFDSAAGQSVNLTVRRNGEATVATVVPGVVLQRTRAGGFIAPQTASRGTVTPALNRLATYPITLTQAATAVSFNLKVTTAGSADAAIKVGLWADDGTTNPSGAPLASATISGLDTTGVKTAAINVALQPGTYWVYAVVQAATTVPAFTAATGQVVGMPAAADPGLTTTALSADNQSGVISNPPSTAVYTAGVPLVTVGI